MTAPCAAVIYAHISYIKMFTNPNRASTHLDATEHPPSHHFQHHHPRDHHPHQQQQQQPVHHHQQHHHHHEIQRATIVILGARGVGKTSLACQFVSNEFNQEHVPTTSRVFYYVSVLINERLYEVKLVDCSAVVRFPVNSLQEWNEHRGTGLRSASAYLLVYDVTDEDSFGYVRSIRDQIMRSRNTHDVPIYVAANKQDLLLVQPPSNSSASAAAATAGPASSSFDRGPSTVSSKRDLANVVKKQWKCGFVEVSSKHNWRVTTLFKELMRAVDHVNFAHKPTSSTRALQDAIRNNHCVIL